MNLGSITNIYSDGSDRISQKQRSKSAETRAKRKKAIALVFDGQAIVAVAKLMELKVNTLTSWVTQERNGKY